MSNRNSHVLAATLVPIFILVLIGCGGSGFSMSESGSSTAETDSGTDDSTGDSGSNIPNNDTTGNTTDNEAEDTNRCQQNPVMHGFAPTNVPSA